MAEKNVRRKTQERRDQVLQMVQDGNQVTVDDVAEALGINRQSANLLLRGMTTDKALNRGRAGRVAVYELPKVRVPRRRRTGAEQGEEAATAPQSQTSATELQAEGAPSAEEVRAAFYFDAGRPRMRLEIGEAAVMLDHGRAGCLKGLLEAYLAMPEMLPPIQGSRTWQEATPPLAQTMDSREIEGAEASAAAAEALHEEAPELADVNG